ncbi:hypothetical protein M422DRAFT_212294 [Sphaerobolus stellatus SS14]|uniref:Required for respiratory growth protein 9, mitochondrial n=1 Tax=Sphaerobolus stellatus (strain SS14) TaxID=990650 RepID=A0A0C9U0S4_SPHS4|nr:hypothetical protein M422DRAFT_212294 [Sphaerobolus stellatus SS14]
MSQTFRVVGKAAIPRPKDWKLPRSYALKPQNPSNASSSAAPEPAKPVTTRPPSGPTPQMHARHRMALKQKFPEGWLPPKKLSRDAMESLREMHHYSPETFTTPVLADKFRISPEAVAKILRSKWVPSKERMQDIRAKEEQKRAGRHKDRLKKEWAEGMDRGVLRAKKREEDKLELS